MKKNSNAAKAMSVHKKGGEKSYWYPADGSCVDKKQQSNTHYGYLQLNTARLSLCMNKMEMHWFLGVHRQMYFRMETGKARIPQRVQDLLREAHDIVYVRYECYSVIMSFLSEQMGDAILANEIAHRICALRDYICPKD